MRSVITRCSLVVRLVDLVTGKPPLSSAVHLELQHVHKRPIRKSDGLLVFTDLPPGQHWLMLESPWFEAQTVEVHTGHLDPLHPVITLPLHPSSGYPFKTGATVLHLSLCDQQAQPLPCMPLRLELQDSGACARLTADGAAGEQEIETIQLLGPLRAGERFRLQHRLLEQPLDVWIDERAGDGKRYRLLHPLTGSAPKGSLLLPLVIGATDRKGSMTAVFRDGLPDGCKLKLVAGEAAAPAGVLELTLASGQTQRKQVQLPS